MNKKNICHSLPAVMTFINTLIFLPYIVETGWKSLVAGVLVILSIFLIVAYASRLFCKGIGNFKFTLATDAFFMGSLAIIPYFAGWEDTEILLLTALIPAADVVRFFCCRKEARARRMAGHGERMYLCAEAVLLAMTVGIVIAWNSLEQASIHPEGLFVSAIFFIMGFLLLGSRSLRNTYADEGEASILLICIPIAVFVYGLETGETTVHKAFPAITSVLCAIIIELDRLRCR